VPAFSDPSPERGATLTAMAILLGVLFVGITIVADTFGIVPSTSRACRRSSARSAAKIYGNDTIAFYLYQAFTALILFLAANTSFNAFPRLRDPRARRLHAAQLHFRGDRLAFTSGIVILSVARSR
jgi:hypothetical protein